MIIGESGSGKTTLLKCMVGLNEIDGGQILYDGRSFTELDFKEKKEIRKEIGMLFQGGALFDSKTVEENVVFPISMFTNMSESEKRDRANFCLQRVNLNNANNLFPSEISGGMQDLIQRLPS
jgi:phospholipid/cholesterol/gamma-HCH transport system ATP-binding protein